MDTTKILNALDEFAKNKSKDIPKELDDYLRAVATSGDPVYQWSLVKCLFRQKLVNVISEFYESCPMMDVPLSPNVDAFNYETIKSRLLTRYDTFSGAPFTIQRLAELLTAPRKQYNRVDKYMRAIEKNIWVVSTREPGRRESPPSDCSLVNGMLSNVLHSNNVKNNQDRLKRQSELFDDEEEVEETQVPVGTLPIDEAQAPSEVVDETAIPDTPDSPVDDSTSEPDCNSCGDECEIRELPDPVQPPEDSESRDGEEFSNSAHMSASEPPEDNEASEPPEDNEPIQEKIEQGEEASEPEVNEEKAKTETPGAFSAVSITEIVEKAPAESIEPEKLEPNDDGSNNTEESNDGESNNIAETNDDDSNNIEGTNDDDSNNIEGTKYDDDSNNIEGTNDEESNNIEETNDESNNIEETNDDDSNNIVETCEEKKSELKRKLEEIEDDAEEIPTKKFEPEEAVIFQEKTVETPELESEVPQPQVTLSAEDDEAPKTLVEQEEVVEQAEAVPEVTDVCSIVEEEGKSMDSAEVEEKVEMVIEEVDQAMEVDETDSTQSPMVQEDVGEPMEDSDVNEVCAN